MSAIKEKLNQANSIKAIMEVIEKKKMQDISPTEVDLIARKIDQCDMDSPLKIHFLSNYTIQPLDKYLTVACAINSIYVKCSVAPYGQYYQQLLDDSSELLTGLPEIVVLALSLETISPKVVHSFCSISKQELDEIYQQVLSHVEEWLELASKKLNSIFIVSNFVIPAYLQKGIADTKSDSSEKSFYFKLNNALQEKFKESSNVFVLDLDFLASEFGRRNVFSSKMYYLAKMPWSDSFYSYIASELSNYIRATKGVNKKCLVVDLDNTLWGGVLGEDGINGVKVGVNDAVSEAYYAFQHVIKSYEMRGVVLAICSKNNVGDVEELFEKRASDLPLNLDDFSVKKINWENKHINIEAIAKSLNISLDSIVFIDDNPVEVNMVKELLPEVETILMQGDPSEFPALLRETNYFERLIVLNDDLKKTHQYKQNSMRQSLKEKANDLESYLKSLETEVTFREAQESDINRLHQLFTKTNQFNLTTKRYSISDVEEFIISNAYLFYAVDAKDKFGEMGTIGLVLVNMVDSTVDIDSLILSCRAMGRKIEYALMNCLVNKLFYEKEIQNINAEYRPTKKNIPVIEYYDNCGFSHAETDNQEFKRYSLAKKNVKDLEVKSINVITIG